MNLLINQF